MSPYSSKHSEYYFASSGMRCKLDTEQRALFRDILRASDIQHPEKHAETPATILLSLAGSYIRCH